MESCKRKPEPKCKQGKGYLKRNNTRHDFKTSEGADGQFQRRRVKIHQDSSCNRLSKEVSYLSFLSDPFRLRLNHFFLTDLSLPSSAASFLPGLSSPGILLLLLLLPPLLRWLAVPLLLANLFTVNEEWMLSRSFSSSSTYVSFWSSQYHRDGITRNTLNQLWTKQASNHNEKRRFLGLITTSKKALYFII